MYLAVSTRQIMLPITPSISPFQFIPGASITFWDSCFSSSLTTVVSCLIMSSMSKQLSLSGFCFLLDGSSPSLSIFLLEISFSSTVSKLTSDPSSENLIHHLSASFFRCRMWTLVPLYLGLMVHLVGFSFDFEFFK